jgi:3-hydroxy-5-methyl-1-naphthoate 3-O-methyltransferase
LTAAIVELDLFSRLAAQPGTLSNTCEMLGIQPRPTDVMLTLFVAMDLLRCDGETYRVTPVAEEHLVASSPLSLAPYYASFRMRPIVQDFVSILRTGRPCNWASAAQGEWVDAMKRPDFARQFTAAMDCRGLYLARGVARAVAFKPHRRLLDVAGGSGVYACCLVEEHPHLRATVLERPPVDEVAQRAIAERGFSDRVSVHAADMLSEPFPGGFDVHLFSNVLHDWDVPRVTQLLAASAASLSSGGIVIVHDAHLNEAKTGPYPVAAYSCLLMHSTEGRCYGSGEMRDLLHQTGFTNAECLQTLGDRSVIVASKA